MIPNSETAVSVYAPATHASSRLGFLYQVPRALKLHPAPDSGAALGGSFQLPFRQRDPQNAHSTVVRQRVSHAGERVDRSRENTHVPLALFTPASH